MRSDFDEMALRKGVWGLYRTCLECLSAPAPVREATYQVVVCHVWSGTEKSHDQLLGYKSGSFELIGESDKQLIQIGLYCSMHDRQVTFISSDRLYNSYG